MTGPSYARFQHSSSSTRFESQVGSSSKEVGVFTKNFGDSRTQISRIKSQGGSFKRINKPNTFKEATKPPKQHKYQNGLKRFTAMAAFQIENN